MTAVGHMEHRRGRELLGAVDVVVVAVGEGGDGTLLLARVCTRSRGTTQGLTEDLTTLVG